MNDAQLIERLAGTDAYAADSPMPDEIWTPDVALHEIERRTGMQTQEQTQVRVTPPPKKRPKRLLAAAAAFAVIAVIVMAAAIWFSGGSDKPPDVLNDGPLAPLGVGEALNEARITGDLEGWRQLYADEATFSDLVGMEGGSISLLATFRDPGQPGVDWDGDAAVTVFDHFLGIAMADYAAGVTNTHIRSESS